MTKNLSYYIHCFTHLKRDMKNGGAPHKPILLLSVIGLLEKGIYTNSQIFILPELVASFKSNWSKLVETNHFPIFAMPFYHLSSESFWKLIPNVGCEKWVESKNSMVDACHIVPFSESYDDTLTNGIALCPNLHRAFDRGLISISDDYTVLINKNFVEDKNSAFSLSQFGNQKIILPYSEELYWERKVNK